MVPGCDGCTLPSEGRGNRFDSYRDYCMPQPSNGASDSNAGEVGLTPTWGTLRL